VCLGDGVKRDLPLFNPPAPAQNLPEFRGPDFLFPEMLQLAPANTTVTARTARSWIPHVPAHKAKIFRAPYQQNAWAGFNQALSDLPDVTDFEKSTYPDIFALEGGIAPDGTTVGGITVEKLRELKDKIPDVAEKTLPRDLTAQQQMRFYRAYMGKALRLAGGSKALDTLIDPGVARYVADTLFREGDTGGAKLIQRALNDTLRAHALQEAEPLGRDALTVLHHIIRYPNDRRTFLEKLYFARAKKRPKEWQRNQYMFQRAFEGNY
jgi:hypothetical protein